MYRYAIESESEENNPRNFLNDDMDNHQYHTSVSIIFFRMWKKWETNRYSFLGSYSEKGMIECQKNLSIPQFLSFCCRWIWKFDTYYKLKELHKDHKNAVIYLSNLEKILKKSKMV